MKSKPNDQVKQFRKAAKALGADESEERFNAALKKIAKKSKAIENLSDALGQSDPNWTKNGKPKCK